MREFDLVSIDWDTVRLLQAGQFTHETNYMEELVRWTLQRGRIFGILHLSDEGISRPSPEGERMFSVSVRGCYAVAEQGQMVEIPDDRDFAVSGTIEARTQTVPLYLGVGIVDKAKEPELHPSKSVGLLQCGGRHLDYILAADNSDENYDWVQIAQFVKTQAGLAFDSDYIPECMFLSSHGSLWKSQQDIQSLANEALEALEKHSSDAVQVFATAAALAGSLGPAARMVDGRMHPRAYVDRLVGILAGQRSQLVTLPKINLAIYTETLNQIRDTLVYMDDEWTLGQALLMIRQCFERILKLYPPLLQELGKVAPVRERVSMDHDSVVRAPQPGTSAIQPYRQPTQEPQPYDPEPQQPQQPQTPKKPGGGIWRR